MFFYSLLYGVVTRKEALSGYLYLVFKFIFIHFLLSGLILSFAYKKIAETYLMKSEKETHSNVKG
jgi:hypothetical protein